MRKIRIKFLNPNNPFVKFGLSVLKGSVITIVSVFATFGIVIAVSTFARAGSLTPPAAPAGTMQTIDTAVSALNTRHTNIDARVDNAYSAAYVACPAYNCSYGGGSASCVSGWTNIGTTYDHTACSGNSIALNCVICALPR